MMTVAIYLKELFASILANTPFNNVSKNGPFLIGIARFSWYNIPKRGKYQITTKYTHNTAKH
jgi:hypothetical protein